MISYSRRTLQQIVEEVFVRASGHINPDNLDWNTTVKYINQAIKEAVGIAYKYKDWQNIKRTYCTYLNTGFNIDRGLIKIVRVLFTENADYSQPWVEGRYASPREYYSVASSYWAGHITLRYSHANPVYTIWGSKSAWIAGAHIGESYPSIYYAPSDMYAIIEYYGYPDEIAENDDLLPLPYEFEDYVINSCLYRLYSRTGVQELATFLYKKLEQERARILKIFSEGKALETKVQDKAIESIMPMGDQK